MQTYDLIMLVVLVAATAFGAWKGLAWQIASFCSITLSYVVALNFREPVANVLGAEPPWNTFVAMFLLFVGTSAVVWLVFGFVQDFIDKIKLRDFDRHTGAVLGFGKGVLFCIIITLFSVTLLSPVQKEHVIHSQSGYYIAYALDRSTAIVPGELHDVIGPYIDKLENHEHIETSEVADQSPTGQTGQSGIWERLMGSGSESATADPQAASPWGQSPQIQTPQPTTESQFQPTQPAYAQPFNQAGGQTNNNQPTTGYPYSGQQNNYQQNYPPAPPANTVYPGQPQPFQR
jgi:membrane protein required for colicin V production